MRAPPPTPHALEASRRNTGVNLLVVGMLLGGLSQFLFLVVNDLLLSKHPGVELQAMIVGALFAIPLLVVYLGVPWIVDRYDPEPTWALALCLAWGAVGAGGISLFVNSVTHAVLEGVAGKAAGGLFTSVVCAPLVEESTKAFAVFCMFYFFRRQFDGVVDGVIYGTYAALGFACFENIIYFSDAAKTEVLKGETGLLLGQVLQRGILKPWGHPLYTAITGLGFGLARETNRRSVKWLAPLGCFTIAVALHAFWNLSASFVGRLMLPLFFIFVTAFFVMVLVLVKRKGKLIRDHLRDEVLMGNLTAWELDLVTSPLARLRATTSFGGALGRRFVDTAARLGISKWHLGRATQGRRQTVSASHVLPLRQELHRLRHAVSIARRSPVELPRPWTPGSAGGRARPPR